jgi:hypothetical protein
LRRLPRKVPPQEWLSTKISFDIKQNRDWTVVLFKQQGWKEPAEFMHHCSTKWAVFLLSFKSLSKPAKVRGGSATPPLVHKRRQL